MGREQNRIGILIQLSIMHRIRNMVISPTWLKQACRSWMRLEAAKTILFDGAWAKSHFYTILDRGNRVYL